MPGPGRLFRGRLPQSAAQALADPRQHRDGRRCRSERQIGIQEVRQRAAERPQIAQLEYRAFTYLLLQDQIELVDCRVLQIRCQEE